jgi:hypothetical protein
VLRQSEAPELLVAAIRGFCLPLLRAREVERHQSIQRRLRQLLQDLHEGEALADTTLKPDTSPTRPII